MNEFHYIYLYNNKSNYIHLALYFFDFAGLAPLTFCALVSAFLAAVAFGAAFCSFFF